MAYMTCQHARCLLRRENTSKKSACVAFIAIDVKRQSLA